MYSILKYILMYMKENNINLRRFKVPYTLFPKYFNQAVLEELRALSGNKSDTSIELGPEEYEFVFGNDGKLYLYIASNDGQNHIIIGDDIRGSFPKPGLFYYYTEDEMVCNMYIQKVLNEGTPDIEPVRPKIRENILAQHPNMSAKDKVLFETYQIREFIRENKDNIVIDQRDIDRDLKECIENIAGYLFKEYVSVINKDIIERTRADGIDYIEPEGERVAKGNKGSSQNSRERVYPPIKIEARMNILESLPYKYHEYAYIGNSKNTTHICYLYEVEKNTYALVIDPYNGQKHMKIAIINAQDFTREDFIYYIRHYLEMGYMSALEDNALLIVYHTTLETYRNLMQFLVKGKAKGYTNYFLRGKIRELKKPKDNQV